MSEKGWPKKRRLLGTRVRRLDGPEKATGRAKYSYDVNRPGMLHARIVRCPHAHAKIKSIDTAAARKTPGFKAIVVIGVARDGTVVAADDSGKLVYKTTVARKEQEHTVQVTPAVTLLKGNKPVKVTDLKPGDAVTVEDEKDAVGRELFYAGDEIA